MFGTLFLGLIQNYLGWDDAVATVPQTISNPGAFVVGVAIFTFIFMGGLTLLISRRRSKIAMWVSIAMLLLGLPTVAALAESGQLIGSGWIMLAQTLGQIFAFSLLFTPAARQWMRSSPSLDHEPS
ncbi:hypothetical protein K3165_13945 [Qipengyuania sp. 1XM1-15A]|uniref:hypothetical protein n=1 Tax=Qipengyuania xiamenensis TaxID=2867237 RepID=UPI001C86FBC4|nr:hypothetical protein [Qipengyuania xiamenensis]MBX7534033.1 hypothetical protein [Qipengyuania xiamenensis]